MSKTRLHFELPNFSRDLNKVLTLQIDAKPFELQVHTPETLEESALTNPAIALIPEAERNRLTHYFDVPLEHFPEDRLINIRVVAPDENPEIYLPELHHFSYYIPEAYRKRRIEEDLATLGHHLHVKLNSFNLPDNCAEGLSLTEMIELHLAAENVQTPLDIAKSLLFHYPELASHRPYTASIVMDRHIAPQNTRQYTHLLNLANSISRQGPATSNGGWAKITNSVDKDGKPLVYEYDMTRKFTKGKPVLIYKLSDETESACANPLTGAINSANDDLKLKDQVWKVSQGTTAIENDHKNAVAPVGVEGGANIWRVSERTPKHGLTADSDSINFDSKNWFSIEVKNNYLRTLSAYVQFLDEGGAPISNPTGWVDNLPSFTPDRIREKIQTDTKKYVNVVMSVNTVLGAPMPTDPTKLYFPFPKEAASVRLLFGSLGTSRGDEVVDAVGSVLTMVLQMGIPVFLLYVGSCITDSQFFRDFVEDKNLLFTAIFIGAGVLGFATEHGEINTKWAYSVCGNAIAGFLAKKGMEKFTLKLFHRISVDQVENALPVIGWGLRLAKVVIDVTQLAVTMGELISSPSTLEIDIKRVMELRLTLKPDPKHGEAGRPETAVWPALSDHYQVIAQYQGGTNFKLKGEMPRTTSNKPLELVFQEVPIGGKVQLIAGIYSENGWLCGKWKSDWFDAFPDSGRVKSITASITEELVPLTQDTQYWHKQKVVYDRWKHAHVWQENTNTPPTATAGDLHCNVGFRTICKPVDITLNSGAYQVGYVWRAAGRDFVCQNISILAEPESRYKFSETGFADQPYIAYDQFGQKDSTKISPENFILDTRHGENHLRQVNLEDGKKGFGLNDSGLKSWGKFNLPGIDAMVVHPNRAVIAVSWNSHKMEILQLPEQPVEDKNAPVAQLVSGQGVRQGLMQGPRVLAVTPDGRILVLETANKRIQAFDTKGNPVPCFIGEHLFTLDAAQYSSDLNAGKFSAAMQQQFKSNGINRVFTLPTSLQRDFDNAKLFDAVWNAFAAQGVYLTYDKDHRNDPKVSSYIKVVSKGKSWMVIDPNVPLSFSVESGRDLQVYKVMDKVRVDVRSTGKTWVINDLDAAESYYLTLDEKNPNKLNVNRYHSYTPLYNPENRTDIEYLDMASEAKGYIYVLSYIRPGTKTSDYFLDVYQPDGTFLFRSPDKRLQPTNPQNISAARLVVDIWRNVFTLNYEAIEGPDDIIEPSISEWCPTPPLFDLELKYVRAFDNEEKGTIRFAFQQHDIVLSNYLQIKKISTAGFWKVIDAQKTYDVIRSGDSLQVYQVKS